jgi:putative salt-induced outer membrane protein
MPHTTRIAACALVLFFFATPGRAAEEDDAPIPDPELARLSEWARITTVRRSLWRGDAELGFLSTRGNEDTETLQGRGRAENDRERWRHTLRVDFLFEEDALGEHTDRYRLVEKSAFKLSAEDYVFALFKLTRDRGQGYRRQTVEVVGYGRRVIERETLKLDLEAGPGARQTWPNAGGYQAEAIAVLIGELDWDITEEVNVNEYLTVESGESNTAVGSVSALTMNLSGSFSLRSTYEVKHNSEVPEGVEHRDTFTSVTLVYKF